MNRRTLIATVGTIAGVSTTGGAAWLFSRENDENNADGAQSNSKSDEIEKGDHTGGGREQAKNGSQQGQDKDEQPAAADPEPNPEVESGKDDIADPEEVENATADPTAEDIEMTVRDFTADENGARVTGVALNTADVPVTVDLEVAFLKDGNEVTTALGGTTGLEPSSEWEFTIRAKGGEYSEVDDYEISPTVKPTVGG